MRTNKTPISAQVIIRPPQRKTYDVGEWRTGLKAADSGRIKQLYDLFDDLLIDGRLSDAVDKRIQAVTNSPLTFQDKEGEEVQVISDLIDTPAFEDLLNIIMQRRFYGRSGAEFDFSEGFNVYDIPKKHIDLIGKQILINDTDGSGIPYGSDDNLLILGAPKDYGLFLKTAPYVIYKRGGFGDYAQWLEIFGMPQRIGKYSAYDQESRKQLEKALSEAGSAPYCVIPKEADVETVNNTGNGSSGTSYDNFRKACNEEMTITILGQTLTTIQGDKGARSLGEVHKQVEEGKNRSDMRYVQRILNKMFLPILEKRGFPVSGGRFLFPEAAEPLSVSDIVELSSIIDIPADFLHKKYSIPVPKDGDIIAGKKTTKSKDPDPDKTDPDPDEKDPNNDDNDPDPKHTKKDAKLSDRNFFLKLFDFFASAPALTVTGAKWNGEHLTLEDKDLDDRIIKSIDGKNTFNPELFDFISNDLIGALDVKRLDLSDMGIQYGYESDAYLTAMEMNVFRFSGAKTIAEITELNRIYRESTSFDDFYRKAKTVCDTFNKKWQKTEYETANLIASSTSNYQRLIKKTNIFPYWEYKTVGDDKVRPEHAKLNGVILPANDPRWLKIWPPNGWKCRCYIVPRMASDVQDLDLEAMRKIVDDFFQTEEWRMSVGSGFGVNRALSPEVFSENQQYIRKFPGKASKALRDVNYRTYNLGSYIQNREKAISDLVPFKGDICEFIKNLNTENHRNFLKDFKGRSILFDVEKYSKTHKSTKVDERIKYLSAAKETVENPDEVWINAGNGRMDKYIFVRYYRNETMMVISEIVQGKIYQVKTWFPVMDGKAKLKDYRSGLLIKKRP